MKKIKISSLWCGWILTSLIVNLIKDITKREIELVHPSDSDILFFGPYDLLSIKRRVLKLARENFTTINKLFPNIDFYLLKRKIKPIRVFLSYENTIFPDFDYDFSITSLLNISDDRHLRLPIWKEMIDWSHLGITRKTNNFIKRFDNFYNIKELIKEQGNDFLKKKNICIFTSHMKEPRKSMINFFSENFLVDVHGGSTDKKIIGHNQSSFSKKKILMNYSFNLCPENSLYPGYYTEKVPEAFLSKTLPLAWADDNIKVDFNEKAFVNLLNYSKNNYFEIMHLLKDENFLKQFTSEPLLLREPDLNKEYAFAKKIVDTL
jgi:hypothetical protein